MDYIDISKLRPERIASWTRVGIMEDFYPGVEDNEEEDVYDIDEQKLPYHARALCLYSILLITKLHEKNPQAFHAYYDERFEDALEMISEKPKYAGLTEDEKEAKATEIIMREIRNSFAHGSFSISYGKGTQKMFFVLNPKNSEIVSENPIVISANDITKAIWSVLGRNSLKYEFNMAHNFDLYKNLDSALNELMLPIQLMKIADHYTDPAKNPKNRVLFSEGVYSFLQYVFLSAKITYEQDEYHRLFGKDSKIFDTISLIRNSLAHSNTEFKENATKISYQDKRRTKVESFGESASKLLILDSQKSMLKRRVDSGEEVSEKSIQAIKEMFEKVHDTFFESSVPFEDLFIETCNEIDS